MNEAVHIHSGFVPPRLALEELAAAVDSGRRTVTAEPGRKGWFMRHPGAHSAASVGLVLERLPVEEMTLPVAGFGNVTTGDTRRLMEALTAAAADWVPLRLFFSGAEVRDSPVGRTVAAKVDGDLDAMTSIAHGVTQCVERLGFFVDRRRFHPVLEVARATSTTTADDLAAAVAALESLNGQEWVVEDLVIFTTVFVGSRSESPEFERIPLGARTPA